MNDARKGQDVRGFKILLVEDSPDEIELAHIAFSALPSITLHVETDGQAAVDFLLSCSTDKDSANSSPDLVLLDLHLPKLDGVEVLNAVRACKPLAALPIVVLSASDRQEDIESAYRSGANSYIQKPLGLAEFCESVLLLSKYWMGLVKLPPIWQA